MSDQLLAHRPPAPTADDESRSLHADLAAVVRQFQLPVYAFLKARLVQELDAEDLTQEVFLRYHTGRERFDDSRALRPYLFGIARNLLRERARTLHRRNEVSWTELCLEVEDSQAPATLYDDMTQRLPDCLDALGENAQRALELHYQDRLKFREIGHRLQRSAGAVKLLMFRARRALKRCLDQNLDESPDD